MRRDTEAVVTDAVAFAEQSPDPSPESILNHVWSSAFPLEPGEA
jgi:hypothetical protein